jgi:hypothetical protein
MGDFCAQPIGKPQVCGAIDPCAAGWARVDSEVARVDAMSDIRERNRAISASYANLYKGSPDLKWAGAAAFASKQVGCGMDTARTYLDDYPGGAEAAIGDMAMSGGAVDPVTLTMFDARQTLGAGNLAVYDELYPPLRFYEQNKGKMTNEQILECIDHRTGNKVVDPSITRGLRQTMDGKPESGARTMLEHEQRETLQGVAYDKSWLFRRSLDVSRLTGYPPVTFVVSAACTSIDKTKVVDFANYKGPLYDFASRWPFADDCAKLFIDLSSSPTTGAAVDQALTEISRGAKVP